MGFRLRDSDAMRVAEMLASVFLQTRPEGVHPSSPEFKQWHKDRDAVVRRLKLESKKIKRRIFFMASGYDPWLNEFTDKSRYTYLPWNCVKHIEKIVAEEEKRAAEENSA